MTFDQIFIFALLGGIFIMLLWGRVRYDVIAFAALVVAFTGGVVPKEGVFSGFGHPAAVVIALVLVVSRGLMNSGAIELLARHLVDATRSLPMHIGIMATIAAGLSAVMNNVAALAMLMPLDVQAAAKAKRSPALTLMPLSFASILGGMVTLIGTPPNIVIATYRESVLGTAYGMFDFAPVGLVVAAVGVTYVAFLGWRLIPAACCKGNAAKELRELDAYVIDASVPEDSPAIGREVRELAGLA